MRRLIPLGWLALAASCGLPPKADAPFVSSLSIPSDTISPLREWLEGFKSLEGNFEFKTRSIKDGREVEQLEISFPSALHFDRSELNTVVLQLWRPASKAPAPAVIVVHPLGGPTPPLEELCANFARRGVAAAMIFLPFYGPRRPAGADRSEVLAAASVDTLVAFLRQSAADIRRARDALARLPSIARDRIGLFGVSLGALVASLAAGVDGNFRSCVSVVGGGDLASIIFNGSREAAAFRAAFERDGLDEETARRLLRGVDPLTYAHRIGAGRTKLYNCDGDEVIPKRCAEAFAAEAGGAPIRWFPGGHKWIALFTPEIVVEAAALLKNGGE